MSAIHDLIEQIEDPVLKQRLYEELERLTKEKKFGLVFEEHLPELTPLHFAKIERGALVAKRDGALTDIWKVMSISKKQAQCLHLASNEQLNLNVNDLVVIRQFGEPIFPSLVPMDRVANGPADAPWHTLIEADNYHALPIGVRALLFKQVYTCVNM